MIDLLFNGLSHGAGVALLAVSFYLIYSLAKTFHLALAGIYAITPFVAWELHRYGAGRIVATSVAIATGAVLSLLCEVLNHEPLRKRNAAPEAHLLSSLGLYLVIVQTILIVWGPEARILRQGIEPHYAIAGLALRETQIVTFAAAACCLFPLWWAATMTRAGAISRAFRDNATELALIGFNTSVIRRTLFVLAGIYAAVAALLGATDSGFQAHHGFPSLILAVVATLSVRSDSVVGPIIGGFGLGIVRALCVWGIGARWQDTLSYVLFAIALLLQAPRTRRVARVPSPSA